MKDGTNAEHRGYNLTVYRLRDGVWGYLAANAKADRMKGEVSATDTDDAVVEVKKRIDDRFDKKE